MIEKTKKSIEIIVRMIIIEVSYTINKGEYNAKI